MSPMAWAIHLAARGSLVRKKDLRRGLRQHGLGVVAVSGFQLTAALEAEHDGVVGLAVLRDGGVQLRQPLQTREFVEDEPRAPWMRPGPGSSAAARACRATGWSAARGAVAFPACW